MLSAVHWQTGYKGKICTGLPLNFSKQQIVAAFGPYKDSRTIKSSSEIYQWLVPEKYTSYTAITIMRSCMDLN